MISTRQLFIIVFVSILATGTSNCMASLSDLWDGLFKPDKTDGDQFIRDNIIGQWQYYSKLEYGFIEHKYADGEAMRSIYEFRVDGVADNNSRAIGPYRIENGHIHIDFNAPGERNPYPRSFQPFSEVFRLVELSDNQLIWEDTTPINTKNNTVSKLFRYDVKMQPERYFNSAFMNYSHSWKTASKYYSRKLGVAEGTHEHLWCSVLYLADSYEYSYSVGDCFRPIGRESEYAILPVSIEYGEWQPVGNRIKLEGVWVKHSEIKGKATEKLLYTLQHRPDDLIGRGGGDRVDMESLPSLRKIHNQARKVRDEMVVPEEEKANR